VLPTHRVSRIYLTTNTAISWGRGSAIRPSELAVLVIKVTKYYSMLYRLVASRDVPFYAFFSQESDLSLSDRLVRWRRHFIACNLGVVPTP